MSTHRAEVSAVRRSDEIVVYAGDLDLFGRWLAGQPLALCPAHVATTVRHMTLALGRRGVWA